MMSLLRRQEAEMRAAGGRPPPVAHHQGPGDIFKAKLYKAILNSIKAPIGSEISNGDVIN